MNLSLLAMRASLRIPPLYPKLLSFFRSPGWSCTTTSGCVSPPQPAFYSKWRTPTFPRANRLLIFLHPSGIKRPFFQVAAWCSSSSADLQGLSVSEALNQGSLYVVLVDFS